MVYMHENNLKEKIDQTKQDRTTVNGYKNLKPQLEDHLENVYKPFRSEIAKLTFDDKHRSDFDTAAKLIWNYYCDLRKFAKEYDVDERSKFSSSFLEEISTYLFGELKEIKDGKFDIYNKGIYAGLKIDNSLTVSVIPKDVDFCIGRKTEVIIGKKKQDIIFPIVAVEVKTYLDATMFGEVQFTSDKIRAAAPYVKSYVLMGYKEVKDDHIIAARACSSINEMFVLKEKAIPKGELPGKNDTDSFSAQVLFDYWQEVSNAVKYALQEVKIKTPGKLFAP